MKLFARFTKVEEQPDGTLQVEGVASSEAIDADGETVLASAMKAAIPDYMRFPAVREMHQLKAAGKTLTMTVGDDGKTYAATKVVDSEACKKVKEGVYAGFSIGGKVLQRSASDPKVIEALSLTELSLVDRPANPDAVISLWKADAMPETKPQRPFVQLATLVEKFKKGDVQLDDAEKRALDIVRVLAPAPIAKAALAGAAKIAADARACAEMCIECAKSCIDGAMTTEWHGYSCADAVSMCIACARACLQCAEAMDVEASEKAATAELKKGLEAVTGSAEKAQLLAKAAPPPAATSAAPAAAPAPAATKEPAVPTPPAAAEPKSEIEKALEKVKQELEEKLAKARAEREQSAAAQTAGHEALKKALELGEQIKKQREDDATQEKQLSDAIAELNKKYDAEVEKVAAETAELRKIAAAATEQAQKTNALNEQLVQELAKRPKGVTRVVPISKAADNETADEPKEPADPKDPVALMKAVHARGPSLDLTARLAATRSTD